MEASVFAERPFTNEELHQEEGIYMYTAATLSPSLVWPLPIKCNNFSSLMQLVIA